jgi:hypothetical protein
MSFLHASVSSDYQADTRFGLFSVYGCFEMAYHPFISTIGGKNKKTGQLFCAFTKKNYFCKNIQKIQK